MSTSGMDRVTALLCLLVLVDSFGYAVVLPLLPFAAERFGASIYAIGAMFASYSLCQLIAAPLLGSLSDRFGRRPLLLLSQAGSAAGFALLLGPNGFGALLLSRAVDGLTAGNISILYAAVLDHFPRQSWGRRFAYLSTATGGGILLGLVTSSLVARFGLGAAAGLALVLTGISLILTWRLLPETRQRHSTGSLISAWRRVAVSDQRAVLGRVELGVLLSTLAQTAFLLALPLYLAALLGYREEEATRFIAALFVAAAIFQVIVVPRLIERLAERQAALVGFGFVAIGGLIVGAAGAVEGGGPIVGTALSLPMVGTGATLLIWGVAVLSASLPALLGARNRALDEGALMGLNQSVVSLGQMIGPLLGYGALALSTAGYGIVAVLLASAGLVATLAVPKEAPREAKG
jgi:DHA1 family tetracycline resistance protein-like MFS transporter